MIKVIKSTTVLAVLLLSIVILQACSESEGKTEEHKQVRAVSVETMKVSGSEFTDYIPVIGTVKAEQSTNLSSSEGGKIEQIVKDKGSRVNKGDTIVIIENDVLKATLDAAKAQYDLDEITSQKQEQIYKENVNSEYEYLQAKFRRDQSKANYELIKARYDKTFIKAPFNGIVDRRYFEIGEFAAPGLPIVDVINNSQYKVEAGVPERYVGKVKIGDKCKVYLKSISDETLSGTVSYVGASVQTDNRTFPIEIDIKTSSQFLKPEIVAEVYIQNGVYKNIITIPDEVVSRVDDGYIVYVEENGEAVGKPIEILSRFGDQIALQNGLTAGDNLIVVGYQNLVEGQKVNVVN